MRMPNFDIIAIIRLVIVFICFIMTAVGTARPQWQGGSTEYYFWKVRNGNTNVNYGDFNCGAFTNSMRAGYAFAIMSSIALAAALVGLTVIVVSICVSALRRFNGILRVVTALLSIVIFVFLLIAWAISAAGRTRKYCGASESLSQQGVGITEGLGLLIASWVLMIIDLVLAIVGFLMGNKHDVTDKGPTAP